MGDTTNLIVGASIVGFIGLALVLGVYDLLFTQGLRLSAPPELRGLIVLLLFTAGAAYLGREPLREAYEEAKAEAE